MAAIMAMHDAEDSPHLLAPKIKARVYVAGADQDGSYPPEMAEKLDTALTDAKVDHRCEIYEGALHGWTMADFPIYNEPAAERHWTELLALFKAIVGLGALRALPAGFRSGARTGRNSGPIPRRIEQGAGLGRRR